MTQIKEASTIQENKQTAFKECPVTYVMERIGGYWKPIILFHLLNGSKRYSELKKAIPTITEKMLIQHLKQLEADKIIVREARAVVPPYVTYSLSPSGQGLRPVMYAMATWAVEDSEANGTAIYKNMGTFPGIAEFVEG
ncbi:helix-turn-helix domain-containing protein [Mucilaginibacter sp. OK283]|jgi:DNA-binding HxlR family transcriptional regulator|uniref:winged helix-turn-helix transcriptional regulator n=1 Tax=Mucilaginibacter sp. OK283 TaxID=1881049 RepID=UPI0008C784C5|nr:helix-turn-helix domain-containing protein [Mucilaginibacter sp. OK283]SEP43881.1 transcriptional regulator, HxlR family [Mucilaginibacter sp. OK283]